MSRLMHWLYRNILGLAIPMDRQEELAQLHTERLALLERRESIDLSIWINRRRTDMLLADSEIDSTGAA